MPENKIKHFIHLHFIVFIWGFTAVLGKLISINALPLVWFRLLIATLILGIYILIINGSFKANYKDLLRFLIGGIIIALHWLTFFYAIKITNISITLAALATGALFTSFLEPLVFRKRIKIHEILLASLTVIGVVIIFNVEPKYVSGVIIALISAFLSALFSVINAVYIKQYKATLLSFYELLFATITISAILYYQIGFSKEMFQLNWNDWLYIFILGSVCTAYALTASSKLLEKISPFSMMLTINLEPVYGIILALIVFGNDEKMPINFYFGALLIFGTVIVNGFVNIKQKKKTLKDNN